MEKGREKRIISVLMVLTIIFTLMGGTLSYLRWQSSEEQKTNVVFMVNENFSCAADGGGNIESASLMPASCTNEKYAIQRTVTVTPTIKQDDLSIYMNLWLDINELGSGLSQSEYFRYALTTNENDCMSNVVTHGTFTGLSSDSNDMVILLDEERYDVTGPETYYLYIWIDPREENNYIVDQSFNFSLGGNCTEVVKSEPFYAVYSESDTSLRFYKEEPGVIVEGEEYDGRIASKVYEAYETDEYTYNSSTKRTTAPWDEIRDSVTKIVIEDEISPVSTANWFNSFVNTSSIDVTKLNMSNVKDMARMFNYVGNDVTDSFNITGLNNWDTSKVTSMYAMFQRVGYGAKEWDIGDLSNWDVSNVIDMTGMFNKIGYTTTTFNIGDLKEWDVSKVTNMLQLFNQTGCSATTFNIGNLSSWDVSNVINMRSMFGQAGQSAKEWNIGDLSNWDVSNVTNMRSLFYNAGRSATSWSIGDLSNWDVSNVIDMSYMFQAGYSATTFNIGNLDNWDVSKVTNMQGMFSTAGRGAKEWNIGDLSNWDVSNVTNMYLMFNETGYSATTFNIGKLDNWDVSNVTDMSGMFEQIGFTAEEFNIGDLKDWDVSKVTNMRNLFYEAGYNATKFDVGNLNNWNVSNVTNMFAMFYSTGYNATIFNIGNISSWNTGSVTNMYGMFHDTGSNASDWSLNLGNWNVNKVIYYGDFNTNVSDKITAPTWVNADQGVPPELES